MSWIRSARTRGLRRSNAKYFPLKSRCRRRTHLGSCQIARSRRKNRRLRMNSLILRMCMEKRQMNLTIISEKNKKMRCQSKSSLLQFRI